MNTYVLMGVLVATAALVVPGVSSAVGAPVSERFLSERCEADWCAHPLGPAHDTGTWADHVGANS